MIIPDINVLLYAYDSASPFHAKAKTWWQECLSGTEPVGLPSVVLLGFVRVGTSPHVFQNPMSVAEAAGHVRAWLERSVVEVLGSGAEHVERTLALLEQVGTAGNLVTDAHIAALAVEHNAVVYTSDTDFVRFPGLRWSNPVTGAGSRSLKKAPQTKR